MWRQAALALAVGLFCACWIGTWVEWLWAVRFSAKRFECGAPSRTFDQRAVGAVDAAAIESTLEGLRSVAARKTACEALLIRERAGLLGFWLSVPPLWSPRMRLTCACEGDICHVRLEVRAAICWRLFLLSPAMAACVGLAVQRSVSFGVFTVVVVMLAAAAVQAIPRAIRRDTEAVWARTVTAIEGPQSHQSPQ